MHFETVASRRRLYYGAREVLCISYERLDGETPLAKHVSALCDALGEYAERAVFPAAAEELRALAEGGRGYAFCPHTYAVTVRVKKHAGALRVMLTATHTQGSTVSSRRVLRMRWSADGALQYRMRKQKKE